MRSGMIVFPTDSNFCVSENDAQVIKAKMPELARGVGIIHCDAENFSMLVAANRSTGTTEPTGQSRRGSSPSYGRRSPTGTSRT